MPISTKNKHLTARRAVGDAVFYEQHIDQSDRAGAQPQLAGH